LSVKHIYDPLCDLTGFVEQSVIGGISDVLGTDCRIIDHLPFVPGFSAGRAITAVFLSPVLFLLFGSPFHRKPMDPFIHLLYEFLTETLSDIHKQRCIKRGFFDIGTVAQKVLQVHVFGNLRHCLTVIQIEDVLDDHRTDQHTWVKCRPSCLFWWITFVEKTHQIIPGNPGTEYDPPVVRVELVIKRSLKPRERQLVRTGIFAARCTPFGGLFHNPLHLYTFKIRKNLIITDSFSYFKLYQQTLST